MLFGSQKPRGLFGGQMPMQQPMGGQDMTPTAAPQGMFGGQGGMNTPSQPRKGINWGHVLVDALSSAAGQEGPYAAMAIQREKDDRLAQHAAAQREASMQDWRTKFDYEQEHQKPVNNDTVNDFNWYKALSEPDRATYDQFRPVTMMTPEGPILVPRNTLGADDEWGPVVNEKPGGAAGYAGGGGFPKVTPRGLDAITVASESGGNPNAVSPKGARGLWQVMPATARDPGFGIRPSSGTQADDARVGQEYRQAMQQRYGGNLPAMWGAYNWGPGAVDKARAQYGENWLDHAPAETRAYVNKNMKMVRGR